MTEDEWNRCDHPQKMLGVLRKGNLLTERKARLFAVAACRSIWDLLTDERSRRIVEAAEQYADSKAPLDDLHVAGDAAYEAVIDVHRAGDEAGEIAANAANWTAARKSWIAAYYASLFARGGERWVASSNCYRRTDPRPEEQRRQALMLRCIFGDPFHEVNIASSCLTPAVLSLAGHLRGTLVRPPARTRPGPRRRRLHGRGAAGPPAWAGAARSRMPCLGRGPSQVVKPLHGCTIPLRICSCGAILSGVP